MGHWPGKLLADGDLSNALRNLMKLALLHLTFQLSLDRLFDRYGRSCCAFSRSLWLRRRLCHGEIVPSRSQRASIARLAPRTRSKDYDSEGRSGHEHQRGFGRAQKNPQQTRCEMRNWSVSALDFPVSWSEYCICRECLERSISFEGKNTVLMLPSHTTPIPRSTISFTEAFAASQSAGWSAPPFRTSIWWPKSA